MTQWNDNSVVTVMTNTCEVLPLAQAKRYNRKEHKEVLPQPNVIHEYNQHIGGVELHDNGIAKYRIAIRGKKWWWPLLTYLIDSKVCQLKFRSDLALSLLKYDGDRESTDVASNTVVSNSNWGRPSQSALPGDDRFDNIGHIIIREVNSARKRCRFCKSNTIYLCRKCKVHLHPECFENFHMKN